jgi:Domain of unknown function (DUF4280)
MSEKHVVVDGATLKCNFSVAPQTDKLKVLSQKKDYANDKGGSKKLIATTMEIGSTLEKNSFGNCKMQPTGNSFLPCMAVITGWTGMYEKITLSNEGKALLEDSKATCPIGGPGCISVVKHGQKTEGNHQNSKNADKQVHSQLNPLVDLKDMTRVAVNANGITTN